MSPILTNGSDVEMREQRHQEGQWSGQGRPASKCSHKDDTAVSWVTSPGGNKAGPSAELPTHLAWVHIDLHTHLMLKCIQLRIGFGCVTSERKVSSSNGSPSHLSHQILFYFLVHITLMIKAKPKTKGKERGVISNRSLEPTLLEGCPDLINYPVSSSL